MSTVTALSSEKGAIKRGYHKESQLCGSSIVTSSRFSYKQFVNRDPVEGTLELRVAYAPSKNDSDIPEDNDRSRSQLVVSLVEKLDHAQEAFVDVYFFNGSELRDHGYTSIPRDADGGWHTYNKSDFRSGTTLEDLESIGVLSDMLYDSDDRKLDRFGGLIKEMLDEEKRKIPQILQSNPVVVGLKNNQYHLTRDQAQLPLECLRVIRHEEIPVYGGMFESFYPGWVFPPEGNPDSRSRDLSLLIAHMNLSDLDIDPVLGNQLPLKIELTEKFDGKTYIDSYLFIDGKKATHTWTEITPHYTKGGNDRNFTKMDQYRDPIRVMVKPTMFNSVLENHSIIKNLRKESEAKK